MIDFVKVSSESDINTVAQLAHTIWHEHYPSIIGIHQVNYMVGKFQSFQAISTQLTEEYQYFLIQFENESVGYMSLRIEGDSLFLSKIYILSTQRGKGLGKAAFNFIENKAEQTECSSIYLTVNIHNDNSIKAYEKLGYKNVGAVVKEIGKGYVMDDYKMVKTLY